MVTLYRCAMLPTGYDLICTPAALAAPTRAALVWSVAWAAPIMPRMFSADGGLWGTSDDAQTTPLAVDRSRLLPPDRGHNRERVFADDEDRLFFLGLVARYQKRFEFKLYYYCRMSNHFHLLVQLRAAQHLS